MIRTSLPILKVLLSHEHQSPNHLNNLYGVVIISDCVFNLH